MLVKRITNKIKNSIILNFLAQNILYVLLRLLFSTYRLRVTFDFHDKKTFIQTNGVYYFWHQQILAGFFFFLKMKAKGACIASASKDGKLVGAILEKSGFTVLYGSSYKSPIQLTRQALAVLKTDKKICLVGDGSRGPAFVLQKGVSYLASKAQLPIFYVECSSHWHFCFKKSWDKFQVPLPFSVITVRVHSPAYPTDT
jgi:lysophospholipid acyltransferase (LPLAT)-like uncharacterized protein